MAGMGHLLPLLPFLLALSWALEYRGSTLLFGLLQHLAKEAGFELRVDGVPLERLVRRVEVDLKGEPLSLLEELVNRELPGHTLLLEGKAILLRPKPLGPKPQGRYLVLGVDGTLMEGEPPALPTALVVDGVIRVGEGGTIDLPLSPLGPACLYLREEYVCLRALLPGQAGEIPLRLGGKDYRLRYRVEADAVVLYRYALETAPPPPIPTKPVPLVPKPTPPKVQTLPKGVWAVGSPPTLTWQGVGLKRLEALPKGAKPLGTFKDPKALLPGLRPGRALVYDGKTYRLYALP